MKRGIIIITLLLSLVGCEVRKVGFRAGYISCYMYFNPDEINVIYESGTASIELSSSNPNRDIYVDSHSFVFGDNPLLAERYYALCEKFGDIKSDGFVCYDPSYSIYPFACFEIINRVSVTSDNDWDTEHPAGSLLNDIFTITYYTHYPYIINGYTGEHITEVTKPLSELQDDEMKLIQYFIHLSCTMPSTAAQHHTLTVSFDLDTDRTATYYVELDFAATETQHI